MSNTIIKYNNRAIKFSGRALNIDYSSYWAQLYFQQGETFDNGKVVLQFDDGDGSAYDNGLPLFTSKGIKVTLGIQGGVIGTGASLTWAECVEMASLGHDIECHGYLGAPLTELTDQELKDGYTDNNDIFITNGLSAPKHTIYSTGAYNDNVLKFVDDYRLTGRSIKWGDVRRNGNKFEMYSSPALTSYSATIRQYIDLAYANKTAICLYGHKIGVDGDPLSIPIADLAQVIDYALAKGMDFITNTELYELLYYIDLRLNRDCDDDEINVIVNGRLTKGESISLERSTDNITYSEIHIFAPRETDFTDTGLVADTNYYYRCRAVKGTHYYNYSRVESMATPCNMVLTSVGAGVGQLIITAQRDMTITLDGAGKFYTDAAGTLGETDTINLVMDTQVTRYIKVISGVSNLHFPSNNLSYISWSLVANAPSLGFSVDKFNLFSFISVLGANTISGNIENLINATSITVAGNNTINGDVGKISYRLTKLVLNECAMVSYTTGDWGRIASASNITINPSVGYGYSSAEIDQLLTDIQSTKVTGRGVYVQLKGSSEGRTAASDLVGAKIVEDNGTVDTYSTTGRGVELVHQSNWYNLAYWNVLAQANWSNSGVTLVSNGSAGYLRRGSFWVIGKTYECIITITITSGGLYGPYDQTGAVPTQRTTSNTFTHNYTAANTTMQIYSNSLAGTITALSIKEIL